MRFAIIGVVVLAGLSACAGGGPAVNDLPGGSATPAVNEYIIGPGDRINVFVWRNEDISVTVPVRPDGKISTPLVEDMQAVGKTPTQLARDIEGVLSEFVRTPQVNVIVEEFVGTFGEQIRVVGQATEPQALPYRERLTLLDVMIEVGGLTEFASGNRARVVRTEEGQRREIRVRINDLLNNGDMNQNIAMRPGDVVIIPGSFF
jgi:polysaccharide export outer membrane protein